MLNIAICDDNSVDLKELEQMVQTIKDMDITIYTYQDPSECLAAIDGGMKFDAFLLDILMDEYNGIEIAKEIRKTHKQTPLFFITATYEFALQGYEVNAMRYYLKPASESTLLEDLTYYLKQAETRSNSFLTITNTKGLFKLKISDIYYIDSLLRTINIHTENETYSMIGKISEYEEKLAPYHFTRVHKSFLVNLAYVKNIFKDTITMDNGDEVILSKHRSKEVHAELLNYVKENA